MMPLGGPGSRLSPVLLLPQHRTGGSDSKARRAVIVVRLLDTFNKEIVRAPSKLTKRARAKSREMRKWPAVRASISPEGKFNFAARAVGWKYQVDGTAVRFVGNAHGGLYNEYWSNSAAK